MPCGGIQKKGGVATHKRLHTNLIVRHELWAILGRGSVTCDVLAEAPLLSVLCWLVSTMIVS